MVDRNTQYENLQNDTASLAYAGRLRHQLVNMLQLTEKALREPDYHERMILLAKVQRRIEDIRIRD